MKSKKPNIKGIRVDMPRDIIPMALSMGKEAFNNKDWIYEIKWDGFRCLAYCDGRDVDLKSKNNTSFNRKFPSVALELEKLNFNAVLDGEIVVLDADGRPNFDKMLSGHQDGIVYYIFDILWFNGYDIRNVPLIERRKLLKAILPKSPVIRFSDHISGERGIDFFELVKTQQIEGVVAKKKDSVYKGKIRTDQWLKIKTGFLIEAFVAGYVIDLDKPGETFSSLLIGKEGDKGFQYLGRVESGVSSTVRKKITGLKPLQKSLFKSDPKVNRKTAFSNPIKNSKVVWIKPTFKCRVKYLELDQFGVMRQPSFKGLIP